MVRVCVCCTHITGMLGLHANSFITSTFDRGKLCPVPFKFTYSLFCRGCTKEPTFSQLLRGVGDLLTLATHSATSLFFLLQGRPNFNCAPSRSVFPPLTFPLPNEINIKRKGRFGDGRAVSNLHRVSKTLSNNFFFGGWGQRGAWGCHPPACRTGVQKNGTSRFTFLKQQNAAPPPPDQARQLLPYAVGIPSMRQSSAPTARAHSCARTATLLQCPPPRLL